MIELPKTIDIKKFFVIILIFLIATNIAVLLNIPFLRQVFGFLFLTILPGVLILEILKLNKMGSTEKFVLSVGLSVSFLMFFGLLVNNLSLYSGYETPLAAIPLLISFNIAFIIFGILGYKINKEPILSLPNLNLSMSEKAFLIVPILFPALSIFGVHVMNTTDNNIILMFLLFLIPIYVLFVCFFNQKFSKRLYPVVIFSISISLLLIFMLRFPHIYGHDVHLEYGYYFQTTLDNLYWGVFGHSTLDACLSISLLPTIFQSIMNLNAQEYLFKCVYVSICSFGPLAVYVISKKYIDELYAFLASFFFISQSTFLVTAGSPRTNVAIFFVALAVMVFFSDKIEPLKRKILFIVFLLSTVVSHYSTTYVFFFIMLEVFIGMEILSKRYTFKKLISLTLVILFFAFIFFWYSQVTETAFNAGVGFIENTLSNLNKFFIGELREEQFKQLAGKELAYPILSKANWVVTWCTFILIGIGVLTMLRRYKEMVSVSNIKHKKPDFLKTKFDMEYLVMTLACAGLLVIMVALPFVSIGYEIHRLYSLVIVILSVCFVMGGIVLAKYTKIKPYLIILLILIPYSMFVTSAMYQIFGADSVTLSSAGKGYDIEYLHDSESCAAKWVKEKTDGDSRINTADYHGTRKLMSQGKIPPGRITHYYFFNHLKIDGHIYLGYNNVVNDKLEEKNELHNMVEYSDNFIEKSKIYDNRGSEVYL
ncbi:MAG: hypothetical protein FFODKBPE_00177 [Candidatus Argoarchaeum ethanivorans]|uniref:DUF2206 domain-containing protein n=1 Tax=Candidatus Argoarchaeum ethanivorans TaxID=2608793 RepID=A0A811T3C1_9EURY|nr:MAG: hypothetical protein FFODKBPE_00177 [Candidatus Argoarchaeum ethanivorans]